MGMGELLGNPNRKARGNSVTDWHPIQGELRWS